MLIVLVRLLLIRARFITNRSLQLVIWRVASVSRRVYFNEGAPGP
jgi:hypothetical protein